MGGHFLPSTSVSLLTTHCPLCAVFGRHCSVLQNVLSHWEGLWISTKQILSKQVGIRQFSHLLQTATKMSHTQPTHTHTRAHRVVIPAQKQHVSWCTYLNFKLVEHVCFQLLRNITMFIFKNIFCKATAASSATAVFHQDQK